MRHFFVSISIDVRDQIKRSGNIVKGIFTMRNAYIREHGKWLDVMALCEYVIMDIIDINKDSKINLESDDIVVSVTFMRNCTKGEFDAMYERWKGTKGFDYLKAKRKSVSFIEISDGKAFKLTEC